MARCDHIGRRTAHRNVNISADGFCRPYQTVEKPLVNIKNGVSLIACSVGFASCKAFGKQPKHPCFGAKPPYRSSAICATASCSGFVWLTASILAWTRGGSPSNIAPFLGKGVWGFGKDADIECPKALQGRKAHKAFLKG